MTRPLLATLSLLPLLGSCLQERSFSTPRHKHLFYEVEIKNDVSRKVRIYSKREGSILTLRFKVEKRCRQIQYDVEKLSIVNTYQVPYTRYYMALGALVMAFSIPSYYMGFFKSQGGAAATHIGIGTGLFLLPGVALGGYAFFQSRKERTEEKQIGQVRRAIKTKEHPCGTVPLSGTPKVELLTRDGYHLLGRLVSGGTLSFDYSTIRPLYSETRHRFYYEVFVDRQSVGLVFLSQRQPAQKGKGGAIKGAKEKVMKGAAPRKGARGGARRPPKRLEGSREGGVARPG